MRETLLASFFAVAFALITLGVRMMYEPAGYIVGGLLLALWAFLALTGDSDSVGRVQNPAGAVNRDPSPPEILPRAEG